MNQDQVEIVHLQEKKFIGIPVTSSFQNHDPKRVEATKESFLNRKHEIKNVINSHEYVCPHFSSEVLFTYFFCMEVSTLEDIPEGMIGFTAPPHSYATTRTEKDPYEQIHTYLANNGFENNSKALALEVYQFEDPEWPGKVDVFVPVID
ncbi:MULTISPECIES: GyrI-like domain-containing protein [Paenibacillus]|uniref:GyrI-like domain-containing protein n=1 Tax=Paenibacillus TaxID=44249 RepID=UPI00163D182E|nr:GyrI-like domain-containing protein [Paenibacillus sp. SDF0028]